MNSDGDLSLEGGCTCRAVRYRMTSKPLFVHCCHCRWCQRETGTAFALNAMIEADRVVLLKGSPEVVNTPSNSGKGQKIARCPQCRIALWSNYAGAGDHVRFIRVGTLDEPDRLPPDIRISRSRSSPGWCCRRARRPCPNTTAAPTTGPRPVSRAGVRAVPAEAPQNKSASTQFVSPATLGSSAPRTMRRRALMRST